MQDQEPHVGDALLGAFYLAVVFVGPIAAYWIMGVAIVALLRSVGCS